jgi:[amino group carrier protein]-L-2-aminoadipate 6-kinase
MNILKIGGGAGIDHRPTLHDLAHRIANGEQWIIVHGCSAMTNALLDEAGITPRTITSPGGHVSRYNDAATIALYESAAQRVNAAIVDDLCAVGVRAVGVTDGLTGQRKRAIRGLVNERQVVIRDDHSGKLTDIDADRLHEILAAGGIPVIAPLAYDEDQSPLNVDGDLVAAQVARTLHADRMIILSNVPGLLRDVAHPGSLINGFSIHDLEHYADFAAGRMKKKLIAAREANVNTTILGDARADRPLSAALDGGGTHITREVQHGVATYA